MKVEYAKSSSVVQPGEVYAHHEGGVRLLAILPDGRYGFYWLDGPFKGKHSAVYDTADEVAERINDGKYTRLPDAKLTVPKEVG